jgi:hypothetical protein
LATNSATTTAAAAATAATAAANTTATVIVSHNIQPNELFALTTNVMKGSH